MNSKTRSENRPISVISTEDVDFIRAMMMLPKESKILVRGIILGLRLTGQVSSVDGLLVDVGQDSV